MRRPVSKLQTNIRPRFQREFFRWLGEREGEFAIRLHEIKRTDKEIQFGFAGLTSCLSVQVRPSELSVSVTRDGVFMDYLIDIDLMLERGALGYFCGFCNQAERDYFPTREEAWRVHLFEPFLAWVNGQLASAQWLRIFRSGGGSSGASLICDEADIERPDSGMQLLARLKRLDGQPMFVPERDELEIWAIPLVCNERPAHFHTRLSHV